MNIKHLIILTLTILGSSIYLLSKDEIGKKLSKKSKTVDEVIEILHPKMKKTFGDKLEKIVKSEKLALVAIKLDKKLELWNWENDKWEFIKDYDFTSYSGKLGHKLKEGDLQIPEGIYNIEYLNPNSSYHLSLKINYPNLFDTKNAKTENRTNIGSDIFIHGSDITVGCIPIGDQNIQEVFYLIAKNGYQNTKVVISPVDYRVNKEFDMLKHLENKKDWHEQLYKNIKSELENFKKDEPKIDEPENVKSEDIKNVKNE